MSEEYLRNASAANRAYRQALGTGYRDSASSSPVEAYLQTLAMHEGVWARQRAVQPELSEAVAQIEAGIATLRGIIRAHELWPSELNDQIEGLKGHESLAWQVSLLRDRVGPPPEHPKNPE